MAELNEVSIDLSALLQDLEPVALRKLVSAPLGHKAALLSKVARDQEPVLGTVKPSEIVAVLLHRAQTSDGTLGQAVMDYRVARAWELRRQLGQETPKKGKWLVAIPGRGQQYD